MRKLIDRIVAWIAPRYALRKIVGKYISANPEFKKHPISDTEPRIFWTGWKQRYNSDCLVGQWICYPPGGRDEISASTHAWSFYANVPGGGAGVICNGGLMEVAPSMGLLTPDSPPEQFEAEIRMGLNRLLNVIFAEKPDWLYPEFLRKKHTA